jgi:hypothetical protein
MALPVSERGYCGHMAIPLRRRVTAAIVCLVLVLAAVAYTMRSASEAANEAPSATAQCEQVKKDPARGAQDGSSGCLVLYGN